MPRPKKTVTVRHANGQTSTPDVKVVVNERAMIEALNATVADLQNRVRMLETRQLPTPPRPQSPHQGGFFVSPLDHEPSMPTLDALIGQPHPMYARMGATPIPNQMYRPDPQLRNPATINKIMSTDLRMFGFTEAQIKLLHEDNIFVLGKLVQAIVGSTEVAQARRLYDNVELLEKANMIIEWVRIFVVTDALIMNPAIDNANNLLAFTSKEGEKTHGDHV